MESIATAQNKLAEASNPGNYQKPCADGEYNNQSDLCAQWYAARAARDAADWSYWALIVGLIGAAGIVLALILTYESNSIARDTARRQLRSYVSFVTFDIDIRRDPTGVMVDGIISAKWQNSGQTPAVDVRDRIGWCTFNGPLPENFGFPVEKETESSDTLVLGPGQPFESMSISLLSLDDVRAITTKHKCAFAWTAVDYRDVFGVERRTEVAAQIHIDYVPDGRHHIKFNAIRRHNGMDEGCMYPPKQMRPDHLTATFWRRWLGAFAT